MVPKKKPQRKAIPSRGKTFPSRSAKPRITLEPTPLSERDKVLKRLHLKPSDILSEATRGSELILVTKNGMKVRVKK